MQLFEKIDRASGILQKSIVFIGGTITILIIGAQVIFRYFLELSIGWYSDLVNIFYMWTLFIAFSYTQRLDRHVSFKALINKLGEGILKKRLEIFKVFCWVALSVFFIFYGGKQVLLDMSSHRVTSYYEFPYFLINAAIPVSGLFIFYTSVLRLFKICSKSAIALVEGKS